MTVRERHGIPNAYRYNYAPTGDVAVNVTDCRDGVSLWITSADYAAGMTPEQARFVAKCLIESADRVEAHSTTKTVLKTSPKK